MQNKKEKKTVQVKLVLTPSKYEQIKADAKEKGQSIKQYILRHYIEE